MIQFAIPAPPSELAAVALETAATLGASVAQFRLAAHDSRGVSIRDGEVENIGADTSIAMSVRVVHGGAWGFAATTDLSAIGANDIANRAVNIAKLSTLVAVDEVVLAAEPKHGKQTWTLPIEIDAFSKSDDEVIHFLQEWNSRVAASSIVSNIESNIAMGRDRTFYADLTGNEITQQRDRISAALTAINVSD